MPLSKKQFLSTASILAFLLVAVCVGCNKKDYPCPGLGQTSEADMSLFDEGGQLKESKKQKKTKDKSNGLVTKKQPKRLRAPRKTHILHEKLFTLITNSFSHSYRRLSGGLLSVLLAGLIMALALHPAVGQDDVEHKQRENRAKSAEREARKENEFRGTNKPTDHSGKSTNDVNVGESKVHNNPSEKESKKMNAYSGDSKVKISDPGKNSSRKISQYSGDASIPKSRQQLPRHDSYVPLPTNQAIITSQKIRQYTGDLVPKKPRAEAPRNETSYRLPDNKQQRETDKKMSQYDGDIVVRKSTVRNGDKKRAEYSGDIVAGNANSTRSTDKKRAEYSGDLVVNDSKIRAGEKERAEYSGDIVVNENNHRINDKRRANYQGDLPGNYLEKRAAYREDKNRKIASYNGDLSVRALESSARKVRIKQKKMANYEGDIVVKNFKKGMHPSAAYRGGTVKNSHAAKERYRKRVLKKYGRTEGIEDPNYMKQKYKKPKHDKKEADIWY